MDFTHPWETPQQSVDRINNSPGGQFLGNALQSGNLSWMDIFAPGITALWNKLDLNGSAAAAQQLEGQKELDSIAYGRDLEKMKIDQDWQKMMSDTSYQRAVEDLKKAGLNPYVLMAQGLSGAPSYSGSSASTSSGTAAKADNKMVQALGILALMLRKFLTKGA